MKQWKMITVGYTRIPKDVEYKVKITIDLVTEEDGELREEGLARKNISPISMENLIETLHLTLRENPNAKVTMIQSPTGPLQTARKPQGHELDQKMVDIIRTDLEAAKKLFAPIDRTVRVRPAVPRINVQER